MILFSSVKDVPENRGDVSKRFALAALLIAVGGVILGLPILATILTLLMPDPLTYKDWPYATNSPLAAGETLTYDETICTSDFLGAEIQGYIVDRSLVSAADGAHMPLARLVYGDPASGCTTRHIRAYMIPESLPPGNYFLEGVATVSTRRRTSNSYFRTEVFEVVRR